MKEFRYGGSKVLITSDLLARGIDVASINVVINYEVPNEKETYIHRIGRTARLNKEGIAINFVGPNDVILL